MQRKDWAARVDGLVVFRGLLQSEPLASLRAALTADAAGLISAVAAFESALFTQGTNWTEVLLDAVLEDENLCLRTAAGGDAGPVLEKALENELEFLQQLGTAGLDDLCPEAPAFLPRWEVSPDANYAAAYQARRAAVGQKGYGMFARHHVFTIEDGRLVPVLHDISFDLWRGEVPMPAYNLVKRLKAEINVPIHLHTHNTTGTGDMTLLMAAFAGVDIVDTALSPLGNGTSQPATESLVATLKGTDYDTGLDLEKLSEAAKHFRTVADRLKRDGFLDPKVLSVDTNTLIYQVPGGMLSNLISQLKQANAEDKYYDVLAEVPRVRKDFGYPPLVTPTSQIVGSQAVLNVLAGERYKMFTKESKAVLRGEYGRLPGKVNEAVRKKAIGNDKVITCRPADLLKPELDKYRKELGDLAQSEEDVLSYALFPQVAKKFFEARRDGTVPSGADKTVSPAPASAKPAASAASRPTQREILVVEDLTEDTPL